uniref:Sorting nexin 29 n=1 Tax=Callorhinchus milii TaxID=7868 RepID=A0A4W3HXR4_CALMI
MSVSQHNGNRRQYLLERLLDAVKQCQIRFGGRKEIASDTDSRVICLCAQFETVLQHGLRRSRGLALTAAAIKQAAGFASKTETDPVFWYYVKEHLNKHELQRYYSLKNITTDIGRGRAWLRSALNEHSLERYIHMLLADGNRLSVFYEDWSFMRDEERASMLSTMAAGLNSILFAINIDNQDLNGPNKPVSAVSNLLKESTQNVTSLLKESTQGVSTLLKEIKSVSSVPSFMRLEPESDPLPILPTTVNQGKLLSKMKNLIKYAILNNMPFKPMFIFSDELRQAIVAMMNRKDELDEQNGSLRNLLDGEMEHSAALRQEIDNQKKKLAEQEERHAAKIQALGRENEVLKVQLKKYVGAVQMLKREGSQVNDDLTIPEPKPLVDKYELANTYERKLIEVAEMHGELIEFNERLHRSLMAKEALISQMRQELIDLRGPVPGDLSQTSEDQSLSDFETSHCALINVWIPTVFLRGRTANAFHVYQVYIRIKDDEWNVYRRYTEFRTLHNRLRTKFPSVSAFNFPPKKAIGNKDAKFVEERRKQLQEYLRNIMNKIIQTLPQFTANPKKETLVQLLPFCVDIQPTGDTASKTRPRVASKFSRLSRTHNRETRNPEPQSGDL